MLTMCHERTSDSRSSAESKEKMEREGMEPPFLCVISTNDAEFKASGGTNL
jgi:hypothetical protein